MMSPWPRPCAGSAVACVWFASTCLPWRACCRICFWARRRASMPFACCSAPNRHWWPCERSPPRTWPHCRVRSVCGPRRAQPVATSGCSNNARGLTRRRAGDRVAAPFALPGAACMSQPDFRQSVALFRYGLIAEFVHLPPHSPGLYAKLQAKAEPAYTIPGSTRTRVAAETLRDWLKAYRRGGFDALLPKGRADRGRSRALAAELAERLLSLKEELPQVSIPQL